MVKLPSLFTIASLACMSNCKMISFAGSVSGNFTRSSAARVRSTVALHDSMSLDVESRSGVPIFWFDEVTSTMDAAKDLIKAQGKNNYKLFAVASDHQLNGRGTSGRKWVSGQQNLYLTVLVPRSMIPIPLTLTPLRVGTLIASSIQTRVTSGAAIQLKWPNDILIENKKVCGVLIEMENDYLVIGIGCNVGHGPKTLDDSPNEDGHVPRPATCLAEHNEDIAATMEALNNDETNKNDESIAGTHSKVMESKGEGEGEEVEMDGSGSGTTNPPPAAVPLPPNPPNPKYTLLSEMDLSTRDYHKDLALDICESIRKWVEQADDSVDMVLSDFQRNMDFSPQTLRPEKELRQGRRVIPLRINRDGTLQVRFESDGSEGALVTEYLQ